MSIIYDTSEELVRILKKTLKAHKSLIKENTSRNQRFPFVSIKKCSKLDKCVIELKSNNNEFNESIDRKVNKVTKKLYLPDNSELDSVEELPPKKKLKVQNSLLDLNLINPENEDLDFEEENSNKCRNNYEDDSSDDTDFNQRIVNNFQKSNGFHKTDSKTNGNINSSLETNGFKTDSNGFTVLKNKNNTNLNDFKIPKKSFQSIESIISQAEGLTKIGKKQVEAYMHLVKYLTQEQWNREDVLQLLITIAKNMVANNDFGSNVSKFNEVIEKIKLLKYIDDDFWDQLIFSVDKKKNESKNAQQINSFLSNLYDFMTEHKICARVVCTEAVVVAYRILTRHHTAQDLMELQL